MDTLKIEPKIESTRIHSTKHPPGYWRDKARDFDARYEKWIGVAATVFSVRGENFRYDYRDFSIMRLFEKRRLYLRRTPKENVISLETELGSILLQPWDL